MSSAAAAAVSNLTDLAGLKIFLDGADRAAILEMNQSPRVHGFTTNPSLMKKSGVKDYSEFCQEILGHIGDKPISFEVFADEFDEMKRQAKIIHAWNKSGRSNVYVKIPVMNSEGRSAVPLIRDLAHSGIRLNVTAVFTLQQCWDVVQALKGGAPSILSVFAGRIADTGRDPMPTMTAASALCDEADRNIELLWASTRESFNIVQAKLSGCRIITAPKDMITKMSGFGKNLEQMSLETVKTFKADAESAGFKL